VYFENRKVYKSASKLTGHHEFIALAGGDNIAKDEPVTSPELSPEYIVRRVSGDAGTDKARTASCNHGNPRLKPGRPVRGPCSHAEAGGGIPSGKAGAVLWNSYRSKPVLSSVRNSFMVSRTSPTVSPRMR
jgi:hypothetical protein